MTDDREQSGDGGDRLGQLLRLAGPRETVPAERMLRVRDAVKARWREDTRARWRRRTMAWGGGALGAAALVLIGVRLIIPTGTREGVAIAAVEEISRTVRVGRGTEGGSTQLRAGDSLHAGTWLDTTGGSAVLRLAGSTAVRVESGSRLHLISAGVLSLDAGAIDVDSGAGTGGARPGGIEVRTRLGVARDIGTRFEVRIEPAALTLRVRDGLVRLTRDGRSHDAARGEELTVSADGSVARHAFPVNATVAAKPFEIEGRTLREFLEWVCQEKGWRLRYADDAVRRRAASTVLHGSIRGLTPEEALAAVLPSTGVEHAVGEGMLTVMRSADAKR